MDIYQYIEARILNIVGEKLQNGITVEHNSRHADIATNAPIILVKKQNKSVEEVGTWLILEIQKIPEVYAIELAGVGFLNITLKKYVWYDVIKDINSQGIEYGSSNLGDGKVIHIESVSANPTGPIHIGHARSAVFFSVLGKLLEKVGYKVVREYYINDAGSQIDALTESVFFRYRENFGHDFPEFAMYPGEYLKKIGKKIADKYDDSLLNYDHISKTKIRDFAIIEIMKSIKDDLILLGVEHDIFVSEASLSGKIEEAIKILTDKGLVYRGRLQDPKGRKKDDWKTHEHLLFRSTQFGDESDRSLQKSDGSWTYFAADVAYHLDKINRGFKNLVLGLGVDHSGYVNRLKSAVSALANDVTIDVKLYNIVHLYQNGKVIKMSKRTGKFVTLKELVLDVGADVVKYMMLTRKNDVVLDLDLVQVKEQSQKNPVFYVQYAHARACSVLRQCDYDYHNADLVLLSDDFGLPLIKLLAKWPRVVNGAAQSCEPHRITNYLQEISEAFHALWHCGNKNVSFRFVVSDDQELSRARFALVSAVKKVIASGLSLLNITPKESM